MSAFAEFRWLSIVVAAIVGIVLMFLVGFALNSVIPSDISLEEWFTMSLGLSVVCYLTTGFIAGALANWKGAVYGLFAAMIVWIINLIAFLLQVFPLVVVPELVIFIWIGGLFALGVGALGGFVGERVRS